MPSSSLVEVEVEVEVGVEVGVEVEFGVGLTFSVGWGGWLEKVNLKLNLFLS